MPAIPRRRLVHCLCCLALAALTLPNTGCLAAAIVGGVAGAGAAGYAYYQGAVPRDYPATMDQTYPATLQALQEENVNHPDLADRASSETDRAIELRARDRQRKLIAKIDAALQRIEDNTYGYCEDTGEPISLKRLEARPIATLSVEAQERHEKREKVYRDE